MDDKNNKLIDKAKEAQQNAYAVYSGFKVGAALLTTSGKTYSGCNVENASFGLSICAERNAIFKAVAEEGKSMRIRSIAIYTQDHTNGAPCGACLQVISEFSPEKDDLNILFYKNQELFTKSLEKMLPHRFKLKDH